LGIAAGKIRPVSRIVAAERATAAQRLYHSVMNTSLYVLPPIANLELQTADRGLPPRAGLRRAVPPDVGMELAMTPPRSQSIGDSHAT